MPRSGCDFCCNPSELARSVDTYRQTVLLILCELLGQGELSADGGATTAQTSVLNNTSTNIMAANTDRRPGSFLSNPSAATFWIVEGAGPAVVGTGYPLAPGEVYNILTQGNVFVIQNSGGAALINEVELE